MTTLKLILVIVLCLGSAFGTAAVVQSAVSADSSATTAVVTFTTQNDTAGNAIIAVCGMENFNYAVCSSVPTDTEGGPAFVADGTENNSSVAGVIVYHKFSILGGTKDSVTCTFSTAVGQHWCMIVEVSGINALDQVGNTGNGNTFPALTSSSVTTTYANEFIFGAFSAQGNNGNFNSASAGSGYTLILQQGDSLSEYENVSSAASYTATATYSVGSDYWAAWISTYYQAPPPSAMVGPSKLVGPSSLQ